MQNKIIFIFFNLYHIIEYIIGYILIYIINSIKKISQMDKSSFNVSFQKKLNVDINFGNFDFSSFIDSRIKITMKKELTGREFWEREVIKDDWGWIIDQEEWLEYFNKMENDSYDIKFINYENKGFVLLLDFTKSNDWYNLPNCRIHIHFAFVCLEHRKNGILKKMITDIKKRYNNYSISLESANIFSDKVWERLDFHCSEKKKKKTLNNYLYKQKIY